MSDRHHANAGEVAGRLLRLLRYIALVSDDLHLEQFRGSQKGLAPATERLTVTIAEQLRAEGEATGEARGIAKGRGGETPAVALNRGGRERLVLAGSTG